MCILEAMSGGGGHYVVVWEWQETHEGWWVPHPPAVTRALERAYAKKLTRVVLADADPTLKGYCVNLRTLTQTYDVSDGNSIECKVRRTCYIGCPHGARWEWAPICQQRRGELTYEPVPMEAQLLLEESLCAEGGGGGAVRWGRWSLCARRLHAAADHRLRVLRRVHQPPYPITRLPTADRKPRIPQQHTGSSVHSIQSVQSVQSVHSVQSSSSVQSTRSLPAPTSRNHGARSASPRERKPGLARQILHNLNIFSNKSPPACIAADTELLTDEQRTTDSECSRGRRHSVDTVSTYLSHESKETEQVCSGSLLDCSAGSDDVFEPPPPAHHADDVIIGAEEARAVSGWVSLARLPQWGALCPACLRPLQPLQPLQPPAAAAAAVAFARCGHMLHLHCLNHQLAALLRAQEPLYMECMVCGEIYGPQSPQSVRRQQPGSDLHHRRGDLQQLEIHQQEMRELEMQQLELVKLEMQQQDIRKTELQEMRKMEKQQQELRKKEMQQQELRKMELQQQEARGLELHQQEMRNLEKMQSDLRLSGEGHGGVDNGDCYSEPGEAGGGAGGAGGGAGDAGDEQPRGSMAWSVQAAPLPGYPPDTSSILVTYTFQSGVQGARHPAPGAPYYAVGFPRHSLLPDTPLGREVLGALRGAWARGRLFAVRASRTTGREHVVAWRAPPPPAATTHYAALPHPDRALADLLHHLRRLLHPPVPQY